MMSSRGMGAMNPNKMPGPKRKERRDDTDFDEYADGGTVSRPRGPGSADDPGSVGGPKGPGSLAGKYSTLLPKQLQSAKSKAQSLGLTKDVQEITEEEGLRGRLKGYKSGGKTKSKVNQAAVYTKPGMRKSLFESIKSRAVQGTAAGQWSARKAQLLAKQYKAKGGGYKD